MTATVGFFTAEPVTRPPADQFNADGIAVAFATGTRYGGMWAVNLCIGDNHTVIGSVETDFTEDPEVATATVEVWLNQELPKAGLKVAAYVSHNEKYGPQERPFFVLVQVCIVDKDWV